MNVGGHFIPLRVIRDGHEKSIELKRDGSWESVASDTKTLPFTLPYSTHNELTWRPWFRLYSLEKIDQDVSPTAESVHHGEDTVLHMVHDSSGGGD